MTASNEGERGGSHEACALNNIDVQDEQDGPLILSILSIDVEVAPLEPKYETRREPAVVLRRVAQIGVDVIGLNHTH